MSILILLSTINLCLIYLFINIYFRKKNNPFTIRINYLLNLLILINFNENLGQVMKFIIKQILYNYVKDDKENKKEIVIYELLQSKLLYGWLSI